MKLTLASPSDVQAELARALRKRREARKLSRRQLSERSSVPEPTIKRFESTGEISLRQFLLLWNCLDDISRLQVLTQPESRAPKTLQDVLST